MRKITKKSYPKLGVNIDHVATLRRLRDTPYPDLVKAAKLCIAGGADQITVHLREDRRHIVDRDVLELRKKIKKDLNLEIAANKKMLQFALKVKPHSICVVPERREERTTEGGLDIRNKKYQPLLKEMAAKSKKAGILCSFFIEPNAEDVLLSHRLGAQAVEIHTGSLCIAIQSKQKKKTKEEWTRLAKAVATGKKCGIRIHAGHGIDLPILKQLVEYNDIIEYNIGHAIVCNAVFSGIEKSVREMKQILKNK